MLALVLQDIFRIIGSVEAADESVPPSRSVFSAALESCLQYNLAHKVLTGDEANKRWPGYNLPSSFKVGSLELCT